MKSVYVQLRGHTSRLLRAILCMTAMMLFATNAFAQIRVTGKVVDDSGNPIAGATVMVKGTTTGTTAGGDGNYAINAPSTSSILVFSFMGYETIEEEVGNRNTINVIMPESAIQIESVVSIGYGVRKKTDLTGSVGSVDSELIASRGVVNPLEALQGQVPGVNITTNSSRAGAGFDIEIRGQNSMAGGTPLYVVDDIIVDDIGFLNPNDIERIDILKDASSNAIYGSRGSNGVVLIVTKQATSAQKDRISISYDGYYGIKDVVRMPDFMSGDEFEAFRVASYITWNGNNSRYELTQTNLVKAVINDKMWKRYVDKDYFDWINAAFQNATQQNHYVSASGNSGNTSFVMGLGYQDEDGIFENDRFQRMNLRGGVTSKIKNIATIGFQANMSFVSNDSGAFDSDFNTGGNNFINRAVGSMNPLVHAYDDNGNLIKAPASTAALGEPSNGNQYTSGWNPLLDLENSYNNRRSVYVLTNFFAEIEPVKGLKVKTQFSPSLRTIRNGSYYGVETEARRSQGTDMAQVSKREFMEYTWDNYVTYSGSSGDHSYDATYVYSVFLSRSENTSTEVEDLSIPGIYNLGTGNKINYSRSNFRKETMLSHILRGNYTYKGKYLLTASLRYDGSSKLSNQWDWFPSVALGWRISEENLFKQYDWLSNLKLRASFGYTGNNNIRAYSKYTLPSIQSWYGFGNEVAMGYSPNGLANPELTWEKTREFNIGLDFGFIRGRISGTIDYYNKLSDGLLMNRLLPLEAGVYESRTTDNIGSVRNSGIEIGLSTVNIAKKNITWSTSFTFSKNKNQIEELYGSKEDDLANRWFIGQPISVAYTYVNDGIVSKQEAQTELMKAWGLREGNLKVKDISGPNGVPDGEITAADRTITGNAFPSWIGNFSTNLKVHNFDLAINVYANQGRYVKVPFYAEMYNPAGARGTYKLKMDYYMPDDVVLPNLPDGYAQAEIPIYPNTDGTMPMPNTHGGKYNLNGSTDDYQRNFADVSFVKVKNITLGYTFPTSITDKLRMQNLRVYVNVLNPFVFTDFKGYDPEWAGARTDRSQGGPATVVYQFGLNVKF